MDCSPPGISVHGILQARILEWVAIPFSRGSSWPNDRTHIFCASYVAGGFFTTLRGSPWEKAAAAAKSLQSCPTLCNTIDGSPPGSPIPGIFQARVLEWSAIAFSSAWKWKVKVKSLSRVRLFATPWTACSPPGSSIHGIFQARVLEWGAIAFSVRESYLLANLTSAAK